MALHVTRATGSPVDPPTFAGQHWINTLTGQHWLSKGNSDVSDWVLVNAATTAQTIDTESIIYDDFLSENITGSHAWVANTTGTAASVQKSTFGINAVERALGVIDIDTGTTVNGRTTLNLDLNGMTFGYAAIDYRGRHALSILSTALQRYEATFGFIDSIAVVPHHTDGVYFRYDDATSPNWLAVTSNGGSRTATNTGIAVVANSFSRFRISVNADGTSVGFYIDDVLVATNTTNIPTVNLTGIGIKIGNLIGTTVSKSLYTDYVSVSATFGASR